MKKLTAVLTALVLCVTLAGVAAAETVSPLPATIDMDHLDGRFITTDVVYKGNGIAELTLYENECFDGETIKAVKPGDVIVSDGEETTVETVKWDGPDLWINQGTENEMLFCEEKDGTFQHVMENDYIPQLKIGTMEQEILPYMTMLDWVDAKNGEILENVALRNGDELKALLESNDGPAFDVKNVKVLYTSGQPELFWRYYSPAQ